MSEVVIANDPLPHEFELIAQALLEVRGDVAKASRYDAVEHNAMSLRKLMQEHPEIRKRYHELLTFELSESGLHIAERILKMVELQNQAFGGPYTYVDPLDGETKEGNAMPDPKMVIDLSKEISRLIAEGKASNMSSATAVVLTSKEDAKEILNEFLNS